MLGTARVCFKFLMKAQVSSLLELPTRPRFASVRRADFAHPPRFFNPWVFSGCLHLFTPEYFI